MCISAYIQIPVYSWTTGAVQDEYGELIVESRADGRVTVRPATTDDIEFMIHLFLELARQRNPAGEGVDVDAVVQGTKNSTLEQVQGKLENSTTYVIEFDRQSVGRLRVVRTAEQIEIAGLQILPDVQRHGVGTSVITTLFREGSSKSLPVVLEVEKDNPGAEKLYSRLGFLQFDETDDTYKMRVQGSPLE
jgi:ribosomal protein S18 acetylase RimI-like enzyme